MLRLIDECKPAFVFLENVPAIRTRGAERVCKELAIRGYDLRWDVVSVAEVGAPHLRKRWFLLAAHTERIEGGDKRGRVSGSHREGSARPRHDGREEPMADAAGFGRVERRPESAGQQRRLSIASGGSSLGDPNGEGLEVGQHGNSGQQPSPFGTSWWATEPDVGRVAHGVQLRVDRLRGLGNSVCPLQARTAFKRLAGLH